MFYVLAHNRAKNAKQWKHWSKQELISDFYHTHFWAYVCPRKPNIYNTLFPKNFPENCDLSDYMDYTRVFCTLKCNTCMHFGVLLLLVNYEYTTVYIIYYLLIINHILNLQILIYSQIMRASECFELCTPYDDFTVWILGIRRVRIHCIRAYTIFVKSYIFVYFFSYRHLSSYFTGKLHISL